ncbi:MAG: polynucleotide adenylyltransferase PcnB [Betaproteobacteria bacterium]|nr:polynucleotide adenylyltransferase PcnB [Betaproteobacteria bacterium]
MIKKFISNLLAKAGGVGKTPGKPDLGKRVEVPVKTHGIDPDLVDDRANNVVRTLQDAGFVAYIVGGAVRDLLLGLRPKDFDVATDATPEQVKSLFRRAFIIGRRFRIVHVVYGRGREHEVIEVSTFRAYLDNAAANKTLRMIGDAGVRYREDPVRIIRAVRFAAKLAPLGFKVDSKTAGPLLKCLPLLADVPQSRLFDEMLKLLQTGHALASVAQLRKLGLARGIYPLLDLVVERAEHPFVNAALQDTDRRVGEGKPVAPSFLLACALWADVRDGWAARQADGQHTHPALHDAIDDVFNARIGDVSGRGKLAADMREIWLMQPRFEKRVGSAPFGLVQQERFRASFDFMRLRADIGEVDEALADWWQEFSIGDESLREDLVDQVRQENLKRPRAARAPRPAGAPARRSAGASGAESEQSAVASQPRAVSEGEGAEESGGAPKKRRRRRRAGAGRAAGEGAEGTQGPGKPPADPSDSQ